MAALAFLMGSDGPVGLLPPSPSDGFFDALLHGSIFRLAGNPEPISDVVMSLSSVMVMPGWTARIAVFVHRLIRIGLVDTATVAKLLPSVERLGEQMVDSCDRVATVAGPAPTDDAVQQDRARLVPLLVLIGEAHHRLERDPVAPRVPGPLLRRYSCRSDGGSGAGPSRGNLGSDRLEVIARDAHARAELVAGLDGLGRRDLIPPRFATPAATAEGDLVRWLVESSELGRAPDEVEWIDRMYSMEVFRFRSRPPHWSSHRGWMVGVSGPYGPDGNRLAGSTALTGSVLRPVGDDDVAEHVDEIVEFLHSA